MILQIFQQLFPTFQYLEYIFLHPICYNNYNNNEKMKLKYFNGENHEDQLEI